MEILITNKQRQIRINPQRIKRLLRKALKLLLSEDIAGKSLTKKLNHLAPRMSNIELSVLFVNDKSIREMNLKYRKKDKITDVISFPQIENLQFISDIKPEMPVFLGDIVINLHQAKRQSLQNRTRFYEEVERLLLHGLLHLLGYDHEKNAYQAKKMADAEAKLMLNLTKNLREGN